MVLKLLTVKRYECTEYNVWLWMRTVKKKKERNIRNLPRFAANMNQPTVGWSLTLFFITFLFCQLRSLSCWSFYVIILMILDPYIYYIRSFHLTSVSIYFSKPPWQNAVAFRGNHLSFSTWKKIWIRLNMYGVTCCVKPLFRKYV